jgi:ribosomal protein S18 acetylase RimI-like enzyme
MGRRWSSHGPPLARSADSGLGAMGQRRVRKDDRMTASGSPDQIREARASDEAELARLDRISWSPQSGFPSVIQQAGTVFFLTDSPPQAFLVAEIDGALVGYIRLGPALPLPENAHVLAVLGLAVSPDARGRGVATALLAAAEQRARARGARKLSLRTFSTNPQAIRLYTRFGFKQEGLLRAEFLIGGQYVDDVLLAKYLTGPPAD